MSQPLPTRWRPKSLALIFLAWAILQFGGLFSPGLLDDVDSVYLQIAREMLQRHDFVTPTIDGIRFFDKPPLMYWMAAATMRLFGPHDWAGRLPLALGVLALLLAVYALANYLYAKSPGDAFLRDASSAHEWGTQTDRPGLYAALAMATAIGPYLYTRFYIPDILIALWMTLSIHLFLIALDRIDDSSGGPDSDSRTRVRTTLEGSPLLPMLGFAAVLALDVLTKGLIGIVFPILFVLLYLGFTHRLPDLTKLHLAAATLVFAAIAAPWHILAALRNPAIAMPQGLGLPAKAGWAWFYLYNEHVARFLGRRIPHDYGQVPIPLFWLLLVLWLVPWAAFLPAALTNAIRTLRANPDRNLRFDSDANFSPTDPGGPFMPSHMGHEWRTSEAKRPRKAALTLILWPAIVLGFFTLSSRQEYYHLPALPALAILVAGLLAAADNPLALKERSQTLRGALCLLLPLGTFLFAVCGYFAITAPTPSPGTTLSQLLSSNPEFYNLSLGHLFDLTGQAMGLFRGPLIAVSLGMIALGPIAWYVRRRNHTFAANLLIAAAMTTVLLAAHEGLVRYNPILGSKDLALAIDAHARPGDLVLIDGELTSGSTLLFYTDLPVHLVNGRRNGPWFGSFWPDAPPIFEDDATLRRLWAGPKRIFLLTYDARTPDPTLPTRELTTAERQTELNPLAPVHTLAQSGGKTILTNQPN